MFGVNFPLPKTMTKGFTAPANTRPHPQGMQKLQKAQQEQGEYRNHSGESVSLSPAALEVLNRNRDRQRPEERNTVENFVDNVNDARGALSDNFLRVAGDDARINEADLERVADDDDAPQELREAANLLLRSDTVRNMFDTGAGRGDVDGVIGAADLRRLPVLFSRPQGEVGSFEREQQLLEDFARLADTADGRGGRDRNISENDALSMAIDNALPLELQDAFSNNASQFR